MAGQTVGLVKTYAIEDAAGVLDNVCVVQGANDGGCKKPGAANAPGFLGVTVDLQTVQGRSVPVSKTGIMNVTAKGGITRGDRLAIGSAAGDVKSVEAAITAAPGTAAVYNVIGQAEASANDGDSFPMFIAPCVVSIAAS